MGWQGASARLRWRADKACLFALRGGANHHLSECRNHAKLKANTAKPGVRRFKLTADLGFKMQRNVGSMGYEIVNC